jgi:hypothetical protein
MTPSTTTIPVGFLAGKVSAVAMKVVCGSGTLDACGLDGLLRDMLRPVGGPSSPLSGQWEEAEATRTYGSRL